MTSNGGTNLGMMGKDVKGIPSDVVEALMNIAGPFQYGAYIMSYCTCM